MKNKIIAFLIIATMTTIGICFTMTPAQAKQTPYPTRGIVTKIIDGDRIEVKTSAGKYKIRLAHIFAYKKSGCMEMSAKQYLTIRLTGKQVNIQATSRLGKKYVTAWVYDTLSQAYGYNLPIQAELAGAGMSHHKGINNPNDSAIDQLEKEARDMHIGKYDLCD